LRWKIKYKESVKKDLKKISEDNKKRIKRAIETKLQVDPVKFGLPLRQSLKNLKKIRVRDFRVIYSIEESEVTVHVVAIGHRKDVYVK